MTEAETLLHRLLQIINLGGHVRDDVLRAAEQAVARMNADASNQAA